MIGNKNDIVGWWRKYNGTKSRSSNILSSENKAWAYTLYLFFACVPIDNLKDIEMSKFLEYVEKQKLPTDEEDCEMFFDNFGFVLYLIYGWILDTPVRMFQIDTRKANKFVLTFRMFSDGPIEFRIYSIHERGIAG